MGWVTQPVECGRPFPLHAVPRAQFSPAVELPHAVQLRGLGPGQDHLPRQLHDGCARNPGPDLGPWSLGIWSSQMAGPQPNVSRDLACVSRGGSRESIGCLESGRGRAGAVGPWGASADPRGPAPLSRRPLGGPPHVGTAQARAVCDDAVRSDQLSGAVVLPGGSGHWLAWRRGSSRF